MARLTIDLSDEEATSLTILATDAGHGDDVVAYTKARLLADLKREIDSYRERLTARAIGQGATLSTGEKTLLRGLLRIE